MRFASLNDTPILKKIQLGELAAVSICYPDFYATVMLQGAQIIEFGTRLRPDNWLWLGEQAQFKRGVPVRGGVPIWLPIFGKLADNPKSVQASLGQFDVPKHGDARQQTWQYDIIAQDHARCCLVFNLPTALGQHTPHWQVLRPALTIALSGEGLTLSLNVDNIGDQTLHFSQALHSYFATADISRTQVKGLEGVKFLDSLTGESHIQHDVLGFEQEIDRIYYVATPLQLVTPEITLNLTSHGSASSVLWNPWQAKARTLDQFLPDDYQRMVCVETANAGQDSVSLAAGDSHTLCLNLSLA